MKSPGAGEQELLVCHGKSTGCEKFGVPGGHDARDVLFSGTPASCRQGRPPNSTTYSVLEPENTKRAFWLRLGRGNSAVSFHLHRSTRASSLTDSGAASNHPPETQHFSFPSPFWRAREPGSRWLADRQANGGKKERNERKTSGCWLKRLGHQTLDPETCHGWVSSAPSAHPSS